MYKECIVCSGDVDKIDFKLDQSVTSDSRFTNHSISHSLCVSCGYIFIDHDSRVDYQNFYKFDYDFLLDGNVEFSIDEETYSDLLANFYSPFIKNTKGKTFIDIGAGKGSLVEAFHKRFPDLKFFALEPSKSFNFLKKKLFLNESYNEFFNSNNFNKKFDFLSLQGVLEHVSDPKLFLLDLKKIMHNESLLLIEVPNFENNKSDLLTIDHFSKFTENSISNIFNATGFEIVKKQILSKVPMQYVIKKSEVKDIITDDATKYLNKAVEYFQKIIDDAKKLENKKIAVYGQGLILEYLIGSKILNIKNVTCIIDDNPLYHNKLWKNTLSIFDFHTFEKKFHTKKIFLAMSDCYHIKVTDKLSNYEVYGALNQK